MHLKPYPINSWCIHKVRATEITLNPNVVNRRHGFGTGIIYRICNEIALIQEAVVNSYSGGCCKKKEEESDTEWSDEEISKRQKKGHFWRIATCPSQAATIPPQHQARVTLK